MGSFNSLTDEEKTKAQRLNESRQKAEDFMNTLEEKKIRNAPAEEAAAEQRRKGLFEKLMGAPALVPQPEM
jgi:hypothetical protein